MKVINKCKFLATTAIVAVGLIASQTSAFAFADTHDRTEAYTILPNQSAFWVPDAGANKDSQVKFESEEYYNASKIAAKRFIVPHEKLSGSGGYSWGSWDLYVPTGRLYIVDRSPYSREWVDESNRGTSTKSEGFPCQSRDGLNITVGVSIGTSVTEENAAKFLYNFGVLPPSGATNDPQVIFASVYYGRSLINVMDDVGRKKIQTLVCGEFASRDFDQANKESTLEMLDIKKQATEYFNSVGITLNFIGWADSFKFDPDVQLAVNERYEADKLKSVLPIMQAIAEIKVQEGLGSGLDKHGLPIVVTPQMINSLLHLVPSVAAEGIVPPTTTTPTSK